MPFPDLHEFVQGQFAAFAGHDEYERQLTIWAHMQRSAAAESAKSWREANPEAFRSSVQRWQSANRDKVNGYNARWLAKKPADECRQCKEKAVAGQKLCATHREANRARAAAKKAA